jgi:hypothetical protein
MKNHMIAALLTLALPAAAAHAETFTFKRTFKPVGSVIIPPPNGGKPSGAAVFTLTSEATFADGKKTTTTGECSQWILPASDQFGSNTICKMGDASGELYITRTTCENPGPQSDCWGKLIGTGGVYKGRTGAFTFHNAEGSIGQGFWN